MKSNYIKTRVQGLGFIKNAVNNWQFVDILQSEYNNQISRIGQMYRTKSELLSDIQRFSEERGYI